MLDGHACLWKVHEHGFQKFQGLDSVGVKPLIVTTAAWVQSKALACGRVVVAISFVYSAFFHHVRPQNANIRAFENVSVSSVSFLYNQSKINSV